ncbi:MAG TPA: hypothetical protein VFM29_03945, partial [Vicinamibacteria bacterium]|nr:hypothetical protein [Vicinamibacteria bacterium]
GHMRERARSVGMDNMNCRMCHGARLPLSGLALYSPRGQHLMKQKAARKADLVDVAWLAGFVEPSPAPTPTPRSARKH